MPASMQPLREEHRELLPEIESLAVTADRIGAVSTSESKASIASRLEFLRDHLRPHAQAEDEVLYPVVARVMGSPDATATMRRDHVEVVRLTDELDRLFGSLVGDEPIAGQLATDLRRVLYGLFAVISLHFAKEEEVYVPILENGLMPDEADELFRNMSAAHHRITNGEIQHSH